MGAVACTLLVLAAMGGCARARTNDTYLVALEAPFWRAVSEAYPDLETDMSALVFADGRRLNIAHIDSEQPLDALHAWLARARPAGVVLTPLLSLQADEVAAAHPGLPIVVLTWSGAAAAGSTAPAGGPNVTSVWFSRSDALTRAGALLAAYIAGQPEGRVGILATGGRVEGAHVAAFRRGVTSAGAAARLTERRIDRSADSGSLKRSLDALQRSDVRVVFLEVGPLTGAALEALARDGTFAMVRNWGYRAGFEETVLVSVNDPPLAALRAGIAAAPGSTVEVASEVVWGPGAPLPDGSNGLVDAVRTAP
ncbi:MAG: hypothetical protein OXJ62_11255 [Spirochaetaceae bacterium]|nr:hypothetical protein [Spirochaetaceae bacterium]